MWIRNEDVIININNIAGFRITEDADLNSIIVADMRDGGIRRIAEYPDDHSASVAIDQIWNMLDETEQAVWI